MDTKQGKAGLGKARRPTIRGNCACKTKRHALMDGIAKKQTIWCCLAQNLRKGEGLSLLRRTTNANDEGRLGGVRCDRKGVVVDIIWRIRGRMRRGSNGTCLGSFIRQTSTSRRSDRKRNDLFRMICQVRV